MPVTNPQTVDALRALDCLNSENKLNSSAVSRLLAEQLEHGHVAGSLNEVPTVQATVGQLATALVGLEDPDFVEEVGRLLSAGHRGKVQQALSNGYMLCAGRVTIEINVEGQMIRKSLGTRFLSSDSDVLQRYVFDPRVERAKNTAEANVALGELVVRRQPEMVSQVDAFTKRLKITWQRGLGSGNGS